MKSPLTLILAMLLSGCADEVAETVGAAAMSGLGSTAVVLLGFWIGGIASRRLHQNK